MAEGACDRCGSGGHAADATWCWCCGGPLPRAKELAGRLTPLVVLALALLSLGVLALWSR